MPTGNSAAQASLVGDSSDLQAQVSQLEAGFDALQEQLRHAQRLASIGTMAAMLAHEINNILTPVVSYAQYALDRDDPQLMRVALQKTLAQVQRVTALSDRVLGLASDDADEPQTVRVRALVEETIGCLGRDLSRDNIALELDIPETLCIHTRPSPVQQVLLNLIQNARQAMLGKPGRLTITARAEGTNRIRISVHDTGMGIPPENLPHIFEPFFTTKRHADRPDRRGIGLGLAVCRRIVDELGGQIAVESTLGQGTTFTVTLPTRS